VDLFEAQFGAAQASSLDDSEIAKCVYDLESHFLAGFFYLENYGDVS
jgi:hypothetical protein